MTSSEFLRKLEAALKLESGTIRGNESLAEVGWWESTAALIFIAMADEDFGVSISANQVLEAKTVPDLVRLLGDKITG
jgi:acyl carrier protein